MSSEGKAAALTLLYLSRFQHYVLHWRLTKSKTHMAALFAMPTPLNINLGSDHFVMFNK
jgi:hypothetical protein